MTSRHKLKNTADSASEYIVRGIEIADSEAMIEYLAAIAGESDNLTFGPGEFSPTLEEEEGYIKAMLKAKNNLALVAVSGGRIIGNISFSGGTRSRLAHCGEFGISVLKEFWGRGVAAVLLRQMIEWARKNRITKINLKVKEDNLAAIKLYESFGFETEGRLRREFKIDGTYFDAILMGLLID